MHFKNLFLKCITAGKHIEAQSITSKMSYKDFCDLIIELGVETQSVALYAFVFRLLFDNESVHLHTLAATLMSQSLSHIEGAYSAALLHLQRAVKLDPAVGKRADSPLNRYNESTIVVFFTILKINML